LTKRDKCDEGERRGSERKRKESHAKSERFRIDCRERSENARGGVMCAKGVVGASLTVPTFLVCLEVQLIELSCE
jgi:hypothetical protein